MIQAKTCVKQQCKRSMKKHPKKEKKKHGYDKKQYPLLTTKRFLLKSLKMMKANWFVKQRYIS